MLKEFYRYKLPKIISEFNTSIKNGLSQKQCNKKLLKYGLNGLPTGDKKNLFSILINQFSDFMIMVLMAATILSFIMGEIGDGITIFAIIILNAIMGFVQEFKAEKSLAALKKMTSPQAKVIRDGLLEEIEASYLVPGDIIFLETGDRIPADTRIISSESLSVDESLLTGESLPVNKEKKQIYARDLSLGNQCNMLFMGTSINRGRAKGVVVSTGINTEMGQIANLLEKENNSLTPLQKRLKYLGKWLVLLSLLVTILIVVIGILKGQSIYHMFLAGVSLAVAAIPEGLPAIVTLTLALGVQKMIKNKAIVRSLPAVETLGCATVICSDKTGTLTKNKMTLTKVYYNNRIRKFNSNLTNIDKMLKIGAICNNAQLKAREKESRLDKVKNFFITKKLPEFIGDPTDIALAKAIYTFDFTFTQLQQEYQILAEEPFDSQRKRMSVLVETEGKEKELWIKGATEELIKRSKYIEIKGQKQRLTTELQKEVIEANEAMAKEALRVLAIAYRPLKDKPTREKLKSEEKDLIFIGLVGLIDPPRAEAYQAVKSCYQAGIKPIMITGDHKITAQVIAEDLGIIPQNGQVLTGLELKKIDDKKLQKLVNRIQVYARISPEEKLRIVKALKANGEIVAMTGDGVNDAPAVKEADIGIAMGKKGTDVTKEVSALVLADDNFATIVKAIAEGRKIYNNIRKFIRYLLACNIGELLAILVGIVMGLPLPLLPIQILWVNLVTDGLPALALSLDKDSDQVMDKPPRNPQESIFAQCLINKIINQGILIGLSTILIFILALFRLNLDLNTARTMAFSTLVFSQLFFVFSCRSEKSYFWQLSPFSNLYLLLAVFLSSVMQLLVIYLPVLSQYFQTNPLTYFQWSLVLILAIASTMIVELINYLLKKS